MITVGTFPTTADNYPQVCLFFFFNDTATTEIYTLSLHDALPISSVASGARAKPKTTVLIRSGGLSLNDLIGADEDRRRDRESKRLRGLQVDDELESGRLFHRQIGRAHV